MIGQYGEYDSLKHILGVVADVGTAAANRHLVDFIMHRIDSTQDTRRLRTYLNVLCEAVVMNEYEADASIKSAMIAMLRHILDDGNNTVDLKTLCFKLLLRYVNEEDKDIVVPAT